MKILKKSLTTILFTLMLLPLQAGTVLNESWSNVVNGKCSDQTTAWWSSAEAIRIAENVLLYQKTIGGWTKNINMQTVLTEAQKAALKADQPKNTDVCIDNGACTYELLYLSKVHKAVTSDSLKTRYRTAFTRGISYLMKAQYANGGWPQFYPYRSSTSYSNHITYNDNAMINVMEILRRVYKKDTYYSITLSDSICNLAKAAFDKGVDCILKTQYCQKNKQTSWCAQHHYQTLQPVMARSYELASLSGAESCNIIKLLMSLDNPSKEIRRAIYNAVAWYDRSRIKGQRLESFTNSEGLSDKRVVADASAADMWARFYTLTDNRPFFCDRDGIMKFSLAEIGYERRNGYSWYNTTGKDVMTAYATWLPKWGSTILACPLKNATFADTAAIPFTAFANKYTGSTLKKVQLNLDGQPLKTFARAEVDTLLRGIGAGSHTFVVASEYTSGRIESDTVTFNVTKTVTACKTLTSNKKINCCYNASARSIQLELEEATLIAVEVYTLQGRLISRTNPGKSSTVIAADNLPAGVCLIRARDDRNRSYVQKVIVHP